MGCEVDREAFQLIDGRWLVALEVVGALEIRGGQLADALNLT